MSDITPKFSVPQFSAWGVFILIAVGPSEAYNLPEKIERTKPTSWEGMAALYWRGKEAGPKRRTYPLSETQAESVLAGTPVT